MMRVFVTGADGFVGRHLVPALVKRNYKVFAGLKFMENAFPPPVDNVYFDLNNFDVIREAICRIQPESIIHLAAQSMVKKAWEDPAQTMSLNCIGTIHFLEAVKQYVPGVKIVTIGSSEEYGLTAVKGEPLTELDACFPQNPYAVSKLAMGQIALQMAKKDNLQVIHIRPFNHFGPGQREGFVVSDFASQIVRIERGLIPPVIEVGDLSAQRDFTDVRDVVEAYILILETKIELGVYNICSGVPRKIADILSFLLKFSNKSIDVVIDEERFRPSTVPLFIGSAQKLYQAVQWQLQRNFEESLLDTLQWWRRKI